MAPTHAPAPIRRDSPSRAGSGRPGDRSPSSLLGGPGVVAGALDGAVRDPGTLLELQRTAGNAAVRGLLAPIQRDAADAGSDRLALLRRELDDGDEDEAISSFGALDEGEADEVLSSDAWRDRGTSAFGNASMHRAMMATGPRGALYDKLAWEFDEGTDWPQVRALIGLAPAPQRRQVIRQSWFRDQFTDICGNETMGEAVRLLGPPLTAQLDWMIDEGVDEAQFVRLIEETAPADMLEAARDTALMGRLRDEVGAGSRVVAALEGAGRVATAATTPAGLRWTADDARFLAAASSRPEVIGVRAAARVPGAVDALSEPDYTLFRTVLAIAGSDTERAFICKALASGHPLPEVSEFALVIRGMSDAWLIQMLNVVSVTSGADTAGGSGIIQQFGNSCGPTSVEVVSAEADPIYALALNSAGPVSQAIPNAVANPGGAPNFMAAAEQGAILNAHVAAGDGNAPTNRSVPAGGAWVESDMNARKAATGVEYTRRDIPGDVGLDEALAILSVNLSMGIHVPIVVGAAAGDFAHYVVVIRKDGGRYQIHDVATGDIAWRTAAQFRASQLALPSGHVAIASIAEPRLVG